MCLELLVFSHGHHRISYVTNTFFSKMLESDLAVIAVEIHAVVSQGIAMGWQGMIGTAGIVYQLFTSNYDLTLFPWFHNVKIVRGVQIFTIFVPFLHNKQ